MNAALVPFGFEPMDWDKKMTPQPGPLLSWPQWQQWKKQHQRRLGVPLQATFNQPPLSSSSSVGRAVDHAMGQGIDPALALPFDPTLGQHLLHTVSQCCSWAEAEMAFNVFSLWLEHTLASHHTPWPAPKKQQLNHALLAAKALWQQTPEPLQQPLLGQVQQVVHASLLHPSGLH